MDLKLSENIRAFRKKRGLTQEQLAEVLNVSTGVISKWELGQSAPDVGVVLNLADFFETSVDVLLGYQMHNKNKENILRELKGYIYHRQTEISCEQTEKYLKKFPYDFEIVHTSATLYEIYGVETQDRRMLNRALELFQEANRLVYQNTDGEISQVSIQVHIAKIYLALDRGDDAVALLKQNNPGRMNSALIGEILANGSDQNDEALDFLSEAMIDCAYSQVRLAFGYMNVYRKKNDFQGVLDILQWVLTVLTAYRQPGKTSFLDKICAVLLTSRSYIYQRLQRDELAREALRQAKAMAQTFDANPSYAVDRIRFVLKRDAIAYDNYGDTAMEAITLSVEEKNSPEFSALWKEIRQDET